MSGIFGNFCIFAEMERDDEHRLRFRWYQLALPVVIGLLVMWWLFADDLRSLSLSDLPTGGNFKLALALALVMLVGREAGFVCRFRWLSDGALTWGQAFKVCMMCEFASAVTPSSVGGSSLSMFFMRRYGVSLGRGTTLMLTTVMLDGVFYVISCPLVLLMVPWGEIIAPLHIAAGIDTGALVWVLYGATALWTLVLFMGIVMWPAWIRMVLGKLFGLPVLRRWRSWADELAENMVQASADLRGHGLGWWLKSLGATIASWLSRYGMMNALVIGMLPGVDHLLVFARQAVVWLVLVFCPTPGGSGVSEWLFNDLYGDIVTSASMALVLALLWRLLSYYVYLAVGMVVAPLWIKGDNKQ